MREIARDVSELTVPPRKQEPLSFQSLSEYACTKLLEKYTQYKGIQGVTFQVPVGRANFDFLFDGVLIEYHPISLRHAFISDGFNDILSAIHRLNKPERLQVLSALSDELEAQYAHRRKQVAAAHPTYCDHEVLCVSSPEHFISNVLCRFSPYRLDERRVSQEFRKLQKEARKHVR
jgi:hypothetical protein